MVRCVGAKTGPSGLRRNLTQAGAELAGPSMNRPLAFLCHRLVEPHVFHGGSGDQPLRGPLHHVSTDRSNDPLNERLVIGPPGSGGSDFLPLPVTLPLAGEARWGSFHATAALGRKAGELSAPEARGGPACFRVTLDADRLHPPLTLRAWQPGDAYRPTGAPGRRKLQDLFTDAKVPRGRRRRVPVLADTAGVVWVAGFRPDARAAATSATTRPLTLQLLEEPPDAL
mgnify:CR=1 FL=1